MGENIAEGLGSDLVASQVNFLNIFTAETGEGLGKSLVVHVWVGCIVAIVHALK